MERNFLHGPETHLPYRQTRKRHMADLDATTECEVDLYGPGQGETRRNFVIPVVQASLRKQRINSLQSLFRASLWFVSPSYRELCGTAIDSLISQAIL